MLDGERDTDCERLGLIVGIGSLDQFHKLPQFFARFVDVYVLFHGRLSLICAQHARNTDTRKSWLRK